MPHLRVLLSLICVTLTWAVDSGQSLKMYDVTDVMDRPEDFPPPFLGVIRQAEAPTAKGMGKPPQHTCDDVLADLFPAPVASILRPSCELRNSTLLVTAPESTHRYVVWQLEQQRQRWRTQIVCSWQMVSMPARLRAERYAFPQYPWRPVPERREMSYAVVDDVLFQGLIGALHKDDHVIFATPSSPVGESMTLFSGRQGFWSWINQYAFIGADAFCSVNNPIVMVAKTGDVYSCRATLLEDRQTLHIDATYKTCVRGESRIIELGPNFKTEMPELIVQTDHVETLLPLGEHIILATGLRRDHDARHEPSAGFLILSFALVAPGPSASVPAPAPLPANPTPPVPAPTIDGGNRF
jgi:hypothetical protein